MPLPLITLVGNLTADPELAFTPQGAARLKIRVACTESKRLPDGTFEDGDTTFLNVTAWRGVAEAAADTLLKGMKVVVTGRLRSRTTEHPEHGKQTWYDVDADNIALAIKAGQSSSKPAPVGDPWAAPVEDAPF